jgi:DNA repair ATPase RecN
VEEKVESNEDAMEEAEEAEEKVETHEESDAQRWENVERRLSALEEFMKGYSKEPKETDKAEASKLDELARKFE